MLAILSPAKTMNESPFGPVAGQPPFLDRASVLASVTRRLTPQDLTDLMGISEDLATLNHQRFQRLDTSIDADGIAAAALFDGDVYKGLEARSIDADALAWAQDHVAILSGLYGLVRPLDKIQPYRLEMGTPLSNPEGKDLYRFWGTELAGWLDAAVASHADPLVVDLASKEYNRAVPNRALSSERLTVSFKELRSGKPRVISFFAKRARGLFARFMIEGRISDREGLKAFAEEGYRFEDSLSDDRQWVFLRPDVR